MTDELRALPWPSRHGLAHHLAAEHADDDLATRDAHDRLHRAGGATGHTHTFSVMRHLRDAERGLDRY